MRTNNSFRNILSVVIFNLIVGILGFIKVRVFVNGLSNDIYSLNQLFYQIFSYIIITDIGFGLILNKKLYKAFAKDDLNEVNNIYSTSKKFYKYIGFIIIFIALIVSFFVQYLTKANVSNYYIQLVFIIFIIKNTIDYFFIAPRYVLEADQKLYKINYLVKGIKILETIIEIILVLMRVDYLIILIPGIFLTIIIDMYINKKIYKLYPWLKATDKFNKKHLEGTKDVVFQKISGLVNSNTDIILISSFINPISVIIYTSYNYITKYITDTIYVISSSIVPSYANVLNKENTDKSFSVFSEINILFLFIASFVFIMLYGFLTPLITFWVGEEYIVNNFVLLLFCLIAFQLISERPFTVVINSEGLFKETRLSAILQAIINLLLSIALVNVMGISGVLIGTIISTFLTTFIMNTKLIYNKIFKEKVIKYFRNYLVIFLVNIIFVVLFNLLKLNVNTIISWIIYVLVFSLLVLTILFGIYYVLFKSFRMLVARGVYFIKQKLNKGE